MVQCCRIRADLVLHRIEMGVTDSRGAVLCSAVAAVIWPRVSDGQRPWLCIEGASRVSRFVSQNDQPSGESHAGQASFHR